jgi:hypothetical protein
MPNVPNNVLDNVDGINDVHNNERDNDLVVSKKFPNINLCARMCAR